MLQSVIKYECCLVEKLEISTPFLLYLMKINMENVLVFEWQAIVTHLRGHNT